ncbi:hypothetical protein NMG60_11028140 [Bertholletia excelsa]
MFAQGQDLDYVNVGHSHLLHSDWSKLDKLAYGLTPFRVKHILLKVQKDYSSLHTLDTYSIILHILTKNQKFKSAECILKKILQSNSIDLPYKLFEAMLDTYRWCDSSPCVFDLLFKTFAHMKKFRNATDIFCLMKDYGFLPTVESCNAYLSSLMNLGRADIAVAFYKEMHSALCKLRKLEKAFEVFGKLENMGFAPTVATYNTLISGYCKHGFLKTALKLKNLMEKNGLSPNDVTFNTLIHGFCKDGKLHEANILFKEMKGMDVSPNTVTYNTLINGYSQSDGKKLIPNSSTFSALITGQCTRKNSERAFQLYKSMIRCGCHPNKQTYEMMISTFCKNDDYGGAAEVLQEMLDRSMAPDSATLSELCHGLHQQGKDKLVMDICKEIEARQLMPDGFEKTGNIVA